MATAHSRWTTWNGRCRVCAALHPRPTELWVIGGAADLSQLRCHWRSGLVVTELERDFDGDAFAPSLDASWTETAREEQAPPTACNSRSSPICVRQRGWRSLRRHDRPAASSGSAPHRSSGPNRCDAMHASMNAIVWAPSAIVGYGAAPASRPGPAPCARPQVRCRCWQTPRAIPSGDRVASAPAPGSAAAGTVSPRPTERAASPCSDRRR